MAHEEWPSDRQRWDQRYETANREFRTSPTTFVVACLPSLPCEGRALDVAAGTGRNSVAMATHGLQVDAVDVSWHGLKKAKILAGQHNVKINAVVLDLRQDWLPERQYDVILNSFFVLRSLIPSIKQRLRPGGWLIFENMTTAQLKITPHRFRNRDQLLKPGELPVLFEDFTIIEYWEGTRDSKATARLLARKPTGGVSV